jgi:hypothetical protein
MTFDKIAKKLDSDVLKVEAKGNTVITSRKVSCGHPTETFDEFVE